MRIPVTDEFLLELYNLFEKTDEIFDALFLSFPKSLRECVELSKLKRRYERKKIRKSFSKFVYYLKRKGYIKIASLRGKRGIILTKKGAEKVLRYKYKISERKKRKDGRWLMVTFDIPEDRKTLRDMFRGYLQLLGFKMFQRSVWVCPFDVLKEVEALVQRNSLDPCVKIFLIEEVEI